MKSPDVRERWESFRADADERLTAAKATQDVLAELSRFYLSLQPDQRETVDDLLAEWALSDDAGKRFDALSVIEDQQVRSALPSLRALVEKLGGSKEPSAPYERAKVERIVAALE